VGPCLGCDKEQGHDRVHQHVQRKDHGDDLKYGNHDYSLQKKKKKSKTLGPAEVAVQVKVPQPSDTPAGSRVGNPHISVTPMLAA
jgi:hypothetical protein